MAELKTELLFDLELKVEPVLSIGATPRGNRGIGPITGGAFKGPKLNGEVLPGGGDWLMGRSDGAFDLDVRATLRTDDGALIYMPYPGIVAGAPDVLQRLFSGDDVDPSEYYLRVTPTFETSAEKYEWLNRVVAVGTGALAGDTVHYSIHRVL